MDPDQSSEEEPSKVTINPDDVLFVATLIHGLDKAPNFIYGTRKRPHRWGLFDVYALQYPDGTKYALKVPTRMADRSRLEITSMIESEAANLEKLAQAKFHFAPRPITYSASFANHLRFPYIVTTWIEGKPLEWTDTFPAKEEHRQTVMRFIILVIYELVRCTLQHETDPTLTAEECLMDKVDKKVLRAIRQEMNGLSIRDCLVLRFLARIISLIPSFIYPSADPRLSNSPSRTAASALLHDNLMASNILIDRSYRVKGFINWSVVRRLPIRYALRLPRFLTTDPNPYDGTNSDINTLPTKLTLPPMRLLHDRQWFAEEYCEIIIGRAQDTILAEAAPLCADMEDLDWKHLILSTVFNTRLHKWMAKNDFLFPATVAAQRLSGHPFEPYIMNEAALFCEAHLAAFSSESRMKRAVQVLRKAIQRGKKWDWIDCWLAVQFIKMTDL